MTDRYRWPSLAAVIALHLGAAVLVLHAATGEPPQPEATLFATLIQPEPLVAPEPVPPAPPVPKPVVKPEPKKMIVAETPEPSPNAVQVPPPPPQEEAKPAEPSPPAAAPVAAPSEDDVPAPSQPRADMAYLNNPPPKMPAMSIKLREQGLTRVRVLVSVDGKALAVEIDKSSGYPRLDEAALRTVKGWIFVPAKRGGVPEQGYAIVPIDWKIK